VKDVTRIREALAASLETLPIQVSPWMLGDPTPPAAHVIPGPVSYDAAMHRGHDDMTFLIQAFVALSTDVGPQQLLDPLMNGEGTLSVKRLVEVDPTLGGLVDDLLVSERTGYQQFNSASGAKLMAEWTVLVWE
jgi:hypothetical protein